MLITQALNFFKHYKLTFEPAGRKTGLPEKPKDQKGRFSGHRIHHHYNI